MNRPATGFATRRPEEPYVTSTSTVLWEALRATGAPTRWTRGSDAADRVGAEAE